MSLTIIYYVANLYLYLKSSSFAYKADAFENVLFRFNKWCHSSEKKYIFCSLTSHSLLFLYFPVSPGFVFHFISVNPRLHFFLSFLLLFPSRRERFFLKDLLFMSLWILDIDLSSIIKLRLIECCGHHSSSFQVTSKNKLADR